MQLLNLVCHINDLILDNPIVIENLQLMDLIGRPLLLLAALEFLKLLDHACVGVGHLNI